jgi:cold shock CspA family protein
MADNIKIIGEITETQQISRYSEEDLNLLSPFILKEDFGQSKDYIEYFVYDAGGNLLNINYNYKNFKLPSTSYIDPVNGGLPIIEIDPVKDLQNLGYTSGEFATQYNFFNNKISDSSQTGLFLKEISADRTELRVGSTILTNEQIENTALSLINEYTGSAYFVDYLLNFGNNTQVTAVNVALNKVDSGYEILFKLYEPLLDNIQEKSTLWVVDEKINPYVFNVNLDKLILPSPGIQLRGPNFSIELPNKNNIDTSYQNYSTLIGGLQNVSSSYQQLLNLLTSQSIDINTDYTNFSNFTFFSSAKQRLVNFYNKVKEIEDYNNLISTYTPQTSSYPNLVNDINVATASINNTIANFDGFEYYLYFESGSTLTSSLEYGINPYPKTGTQKPFILLSTSSVTTKTWLNASTSSAEYYDDYNQNNLIYGVPAFIKDDDNNAPYLNFLNMVGHYFDNIWIYLDAITDINLANNNLEKGVSKDLVYTVLQSLGTKLYNKYGDADNDLFLVGQDSGSIEFDNNFTPTGSYLNNIPRKDLLAETYKRIYHNLPLLLKTKGTTYGLQTLISTFGITSSILSVKEYGGNLKNNTLNEYNTDQKVRIVTNNIYTGNVLSSYASLQVYPSQSTEFRTEDYHYADISFSPEDQINTYASAAIATSNPTWNIDDYIGDPGYLYSSSYTPLDTQRDTFYNFTPAYMDYAGFIRLIQFFDNSLFKMVKDFVPARANLSTGITISSPVLERNKFVYANPSSTSKIEEYTGTIDGPTITTEYTDLYDGLGSDKMAYYDGDITGSIIEYGDEWIAKNFNPYLLPTASLTSSLNAFNHSEFNVLLNNVSQSVLSLNRKILQPIYTGSGLNLTLAGYSSSYFAELQDSYETLTTYNNARYNGTKISSLLYNDYTSASLNYSGDNSYGKTATIDKQVRQIGLFTEIVSSSFLPKRNRVSLKYLVDEFGGLTELNQRNKHWEDVQRTFTAGNTFNISLFDNQKFGNQKNTDGDKLIFDSGYSYYPILYFASCSVDPKIFFENLGGSNAFLVTANNGPEPRTISGSGTMTFPIISSNVYKIFNSDIDPDNIFTTGTISAPPTYSVQESGDHKVEANFNLTVSVTGGNNLVTGSIIMLKNGTPSLTYSEVFDLNPGGSTGSAITGYYVPYSNPTLTYTSIITTGRSIFIGGLSRPAGTTLYKYTQPLFGTIGSTPSCTVSDPQLYPYYSLNPGSFPITTPPGCTTTRQYNVTDNLYYIDNPELPSLGAATKLLYINRPDNFPVGGLVEGDKISFILNISSSNNNFTASVSQGSLTIGSLASSTGYASAVCPYFDSASISASLVEGSGSTNIITFPIALSNFHDNGYQFVPNPDTGSLNSLYNIYGDVNYPFITKQSDVVLTYLSDGTYVENRIISSSKSGSFFRIHLDKIMSNQYVNNIMSGSYQRFLLLSRLNDETNAHATFKKRNGKTSYGFVIPENLAPDVLANIDTITRQVKQKLLADQQGTTL